MMQRRILSRAVQVPRINYPTWQKAFGLPELRHAWLSVQANKGGGPGQSIKQFAVNADIQLTQLQEQLLNGKYQPKQVRQVLVPKRSRSGWRPITLWSIRDRIAQRALYNYLAPLWEPHFLDVSYGFRPGRSTKDAVTAIQAAQAQDANWVLETDIRDCFGSIDTKRLLKLLHKWRLPPALHTLVSRWLHAQIFNDWRGGDTHAGTSQGSVLSPLLCNLYLHKFDCAMVNRGWHLVRYADDFVVLTKSQRAAASAEKHVRHTLSQLSLEMRKDKTFIKTFDKGFKFVGWFFVRDEIFKL